MNLLKKLRSSPRALASLSILAGAVLVPAALFAWGPSRPTFTTANPAPYNTFNSITDNPAYGDERNFLRVKPADAPTSAYSDSTKLEPGKKYDAYVYYHNDAAENLKLVAENTVMKVQLPAVVNGSAQSVAHITSSNSKPTAVWDETTLKSDNAVALRMVPGSAHIYNQGSTNGAKLADSIITTGVKLGYNALDGKVPGCNKYSGYVKFQFVADQPNFEVSKSVRKQGTTSWLETTAVQPGETVDYLLRYKNTGSTQQSSVVVKDILPAGMTYVAGSAKLATPANPAGVKTNDTVTTTGLNIGTYNPGQNAWVMFSAKAPAADKLVCGVNKFVNTERVETNNGAKTDTATITVDKTCTTPTPTPTPTNPAVEINKKVRSGSAVSTMTKEQALEQARNFKPKGNCTTVMTPAIHVATGATYTFPSGCLPEGWVRHDRATATTVSTTEVSKPNMWAEHAVVSPNVDFHYQIVVKNTGDVTLKNVKVSDSAPSGVSFKAADKGTITNGAWTYTIPELKTGQSMTFVITAQVSKSTATQTTIKNTACVDAPAVNGEKDDCDDATIEVKKVVVVTPVEVKMIEVCRLSDKKYPVTIKESDFDSKLHSMLAEDCKDEPTPPVTPVTPEEPKTPAKPEQPILLPETGIAEGVTGLTGLGSLVAASAYYARSRRAF